MTLQQHGGGRACNSLKFKTGIISCVYYNKNMSSAEALSCSKTLL